MLWVPPAPAIIIPNDLIRPGGPRFVIPAMLPGLAGVAGKGAVAASGGGGGGAESTAFLARTTGLDTTHTNAYIALIDGLVADGLWTQLDVLHVYATQTSTAALLNLKSSSFAAVTHGSPTFTADRGFTGVDNSSTVYIDTQFNPSTAGGQYTSADAHLSAWSLTNTATSGDGVIIGNAASGFTNWSDISPKRTDGKTYFRINGSTIGGVTNSDARGHFISTRKSGLGGGTPYGYQNGAEILHNLVDNSVALFSGNIYVLAINNNGSPAFGSPHQTAMASIGAGLNATDATNFYNRLRTYMTAVGVP